MVRQQKVVGLEIRPQLYMHQLTELQDQSIVMVTKNVNLQIIH